MSCEGLSNRTFSDVGKGAVSSERIAREARHCPLWNRSKGFPLTVFLKGGFQRKAQTPQALPQPLKPASASTSPMRLCCCSRSTLRLCHNLACANQPFCVEFHRENLCSRTQHAPLGAAAPAAVLHFGQQWLNRAAHVFHGLHFRSRGLGAWGLLLSCTTSPELQKLTGRFKPGGALSISQAWSNQDFIPYSKPMWPVLTKYIYTVIIYNI